MGRRNLNHLSAIPTWVMTNAMTPFLKKGHPWKGRWFRLRGWYEHETQLCRAFDQVGWVLTGVAIAQVFMRVIIWCFGP